MRLKTERPILPIRDGMRKVSKASINTLSLIHILKRGAGFVWEGAVHEVIAPAGRILHSDIAIEHRKEKPGDPDRNLRIYQAMVDRGEALEPRAQYYYARERCV